jgi:alpha-galactosidase
VHPRWLRVGAELVPFREGTVPGGETELVVTTGDEGRGRRVTWSVRNPGRNELILDRVGLVLESDAERVLENGWQSWSGVRACSPADVRPERRDMPGWRRAMYCCDPDRAGHSVMGDQFLVTESGVAGFLDGRHHLGVIEVRAAPPHSLTAWALIDGIRLGPGEERALEPFWFASGEPGALYGEYARRWGTESGARVHTPAPGGWCSWYHYRSSIRPADVRANLGLAAAHGLDIVQIDDGYQAAIGDWLTPHSSWSEGTAAVAADIRSAGLRPGLWTAPFLTDETGALARRHPEWVLGRAMHNPVWWGGWALSLDTTNPAVLDHLTSTFTALAAQGFDYHKVDFLYAAALPGHRHDPTRTRAEALRAGLEAVRRGIGEQAFLLGCGSPFGPAVGIVDAMRVSPDVAPWWLPRTPLPGMEEAASCARNAIVTSVLRSPLHRRLWVNDADCVLLRPVEEGLADWQRRLVAATVAGTASLVTASDDLSRYRTEEWDLLAEVRTVASAADGPLDLLDPFASTLTVRSASHELEIGPPTGRARSHVLVDTPGGRLTCR